MEKIDEDVKKARLRLTTIVISPVSKLWLISHPELQGSKPEHSVFLAQGEGVDPHPQCDDCQSSLCNEQSDLHEQVVTSVHELMINGAERHKPQEGTLLVQIRAQLAANLTTSEPISDAVTEEDIDPRPTKIRKISEPKWASQKLIIPNPRWVR